MKLRFILLSLIASVSLFISCEKDEDFDAGQTNTKELAGEWFVQICYEGEVFFDYTKLLTYNTANNDKDILWLDASATWPFKTKIACNPSELAIGSLSFDNVDFFEAEGFLDSLSILNGKVLKGAATTSGGNKSDSIIISVSSTGMRDFVNDLVGEEIVTSEGWTIQGYKRTGFFEDEH